MPASSLRDPLQPEEEVGILVLGHGTRSEQGCLEMLALAERVALQFSPLPVEAGFLEIAKPSVEEGVDRLMQKGAKKIVIAPLLLFAAGHAKRDIPSQVEQALCKYGEILSVQTNPLGRTKSVFALSCRHAQRVLDIHAYIEPSRTALLLVGRGSRDEEAIAEMRAFTDQRRRLAPYASVDHSFLAMAKPTLDEMLEQLGEKNFSRIVVQPHLLFHGNLMQQLEAKVQEAALRFPQTEWIIPSYLGPDPLLVEAIAEKIQEALPLLLA